jgi:hypothetical protein
VPATLRELTQPPGPRLIPNVPTVGGGHVTITLSVRAPGTVVLDPYPLDQPRVTCRFIRRTLADVAHHDPAGAYHRAEQETVGFAITAPDG